MRYWSGSNLGPVAYVDRSGELSPAEFAIEDMLAFDRLGPAARRALALSRFGGSAADIEARWGGRYALDEAVADRIRAQDARFSGRFNCSADALI